MHEAFEPVRRAAARLAGVPGALVRTSEGEVLYALRGDEAFPAASVIKVPLVLTLLCDAAEGRLSLSERVGVGERVDGSGVLRDLRDLDTLSLRDLAMMAVTLSDNTATNRLIERVGLARVNERLEAWGLARTRLRRAMYDRAAAERGAENEMTPAETAALLARVHARDGVPEAAAAELLAMLERNQDSSMLVRELPNGTRVAHKTGTLDASRNDAGLVLGERAVIVAGFVRGLAAPADGSAWLGLLGWCALRASGRIDLPRTPVSAAGGA